MSKILFLLIVSCLACSIIAQKPQKTCLSTCPTAGCYVDAERQRCRSCPAGCNNCTDSSTCTVCAPGYSLNADNNCVDCNVTGCATCKRPGVCETCQKGYFFVNSTTCQSCGYLCESCLSATTCKSCRGDIYGALYLSRPYQSCNYCPAGCTSCRNSGMCTNCSEGYVLSDYQCLSCSTINPLCGSCDENLTQCFNCTKGHYLLNNTCLDCSAGCDVCSDESTCQKCADGYFLNANKGCTPCMGYCKTCENSDTCSECYDGFEYLAESGKCSQCNLDCVGVSMPIAPPIPRTYQYSFQAIDQAVPLAMP